jgi:hypothetical protein
MDINFENTLINTLETSISSNILLVFANKFKPNYLSVLEKIDKLSFFPELIYNLEADRYKTNLRNIISRNPTRFCIKINDSAIFSNLNKCDIILLSYSTLEHRNYINGFATLRINNTYKYVIIDYLCGDLQFSGIGSNLVSFIKLLTINAFGENYTVILNSISSSVTQNFYRSQFFYNITDEIKITGHETMGVIPYIENEKYNYMWKYNRANIEETYIFDSFTLPFLIKKLSLSKYPRDVPEPDLINELKPMRKFNLGEPISLYERGGKKIKKLKKYKFYSKKNKKQLKNKSKKIYKYKSKKIYKYKSKKYNKLL